MLISTNSKAKHQLLWNLITSFKPLFLAFISILVICTIVYVASSLYPTLNDVLKASLRTPWGIFTSIFVHSGFEHYSTNMIELLVYFWIFFITNIFLSKEETEKRVSIFLKVIFLIAVTSNLLWIISMWMVFASQSSVLGASGLVYASQGVVTGFAILNSLKLIELPRKDKKDRMEFLFFCLSNLVFVVISIQVLVQSQVFLNVGAGVNVIVHGVSFFGAFFSVFLWNIFRQRHASKTQAEATAAS